MVSFNNLFKELFKRKSKVAEILLILQFLLTLLIELSDAIKTNFAYESARINSFFMSFWLAFLLLSFIFVPVLLIINSWQTEKLNNSQTLRLVPTNNFSAYISNLLSSIASFVCLVVSEATLAFIFVIISNNIQKKYSDLQGIFTILKTRGMTVFELGLTILALGVAVSLLVSFLNFVSQTIYNQLSNISGQFLLNFIRFVLVLIVCLVASQFINTILQLFYIPFYTWAGNQGNKLTEVLFVVTIFDVITFGINLFLLNRFVEAKTNN
ncbi:hypothetical protein [Lactobacillus sp. ESL0681]|uniref:hypothetical protein n=1 Tax=Lactobacillus sp. ESL0681 TaxID=2983211 RepID=UPI0023F7D0C2|nr:hypothetical protein [Lactobacillus sp. ESL0681]WEV40708.1 hypothetical protein OZX59_01995 [Lactobacillus sp. ESL0681]